MSPLSSLHDSVEPAIASLAIAAAKRRLLDAAGARQLATRLSQSGAHGVAGIRKQLERESARDGGVIELMRLLPSRDDLSLGPYQVFAHLASGGMGHVWLGKAVHGPLVVIKTLREGPVATPGPVREDTDGSLWIDGDVSALLPGLPLSQNTPPTAPPQGKLTQRFAREGRIHRRLEHAHVVRMLDHGTAADGTLFIVLEYISGGDLRDLIDARGPLPETAALTLVRQVADGLESAHALGLMHRDIKPGNVFITASGTAKLADFGLARAEDNAHTQLTGAGDLLGSPAYMAPERIDGGVDGVDIRSDIYSLGALLFYLLAGRAPYLGSNPEVLHQHRTAEIPDIRRHAPATSAATVAIIQRCLAKRPAERYATPAALRDQLTAGAPAPVSAAPAPVSAAAAPIPAAAITSVPAVVALANQTDEEKTEKREEKIAEPVVAPPPAPIPAEPVAATTPPMPPVPAPPPEPAPVVTPVAMVAPVAVTAPAPVVVPEPERLHSEVDFTTLTPVSGQRIIPPPESLDAPWMALRSADAGTDHLVVLLPRPVVVMGKLRADEVDICLRNYPVAEHQTACQRLSRRHLRLAYDPQRGQVLAEDLGSANGSRCDGALMAVGHPFPLLPGHEHRFELGGVVQLSARVIADRTRKPGAPPAAVVISRPDNRPGLTYVMLLGAVRIGGPGADVVVGGTGPILEFTRPRRHWWWRESGEWRPIAERGLINCGGTALRPEAGNLALFD